MLFIQDLRCNAYGHRKESEYAIMVSDLKKLSLDMIESCQEVKTWLDQFRVNKRATAIDLLLKLRFVTRDVYAEWLKTTLSGTSKAQCAFYAVPKTDNIHYIWDKCGKVVGRTSTSSGSEDLVLSVISQIKKGNQQFLDHPDLEELKNRKIRDIVLIEDSIGSGQRVISYIKLMFNNKTLMSWWSLGLIRLHLVAFSRIYESESRIIESVPGSNHPKRKFRKASKIKFHGLLAYPEGEGFKRWGTNYQNILDLCDSIPLGHGSYHRGYGNMMANIVFFHSVPDNLPGLLWDQGNNWNALFPNRSIPEWLPSLLEGNSFVQQQKKLSDSLLIILRLVKRGISNEHSLARVIGFDISVLRQILSRGRDSGFLTENNRLTETGWQVVRAEIQEVPLDRFDRSLYVPQVWCVDQETVQPF